MALSENRIVYGIHSITPYDRSSLEPFGILKVIGGGTLSLTAEFEDLFAGSNKFSWASEAKTVASEFTATVKSLPDFLFELFLGASVTTTAASTTNGTIGPIANSKGTSVVDGTIGIASVGLTAGKEADLKSTAYIVKAVSATTVDVFAITDIDFANGADLSYVDDLLKITVTPLTIADTGATVDIPNAGIEITSGSGTIAMIDGDTALFIVAAPHNGISDIVIGKSATTFPEHGFYALSQKRSNGDIFEIQAFKAVGAGLPLPMEETVFMIPELTIKLLYDEAEDAVAKVRAIKG